MLILGENDREPLNYDGGCIESLSGGRYSVLGGEYKTTSPGCGGRTVIEDSYAVSCGGRTAIGDVLVCSNSSVLVPVPTTPFTYDIVNYNGGWGMIEGNVAPSRYTELNAMYHFYFYGTKGEYEAKYGVYWSSFTYIDPAKKIYVGEI